jgi:hypothetical protein
VKSQVLILRKQRREDHAEEEPVECRFPDREIEEPGSSSGIVERRSYERGRALRSVVLSVVVSEQEVLCFL